MKPPLEMDASVGATVSAGSRTLIERAYAQLRNDIIEGKLVPGDKLRVEHLKLHYGVGAGTLREAITRLVSDALVTAEGQRGFRVTPITLEELEDITRLRLHIELEALRQAIRHGGAAWREELRQSYEALSALERPFQAQNRPQWEALNMRFHAALLSGQQSAWTQKVLCLLSRHSERYRRYTMGLPGAGRNVHSEHKAIFEAAMAGHEARAALALEAHIRATPDLLAQALGNGTLTLPSQGESCNATHGNANTSASAIAQSMALE